MAPGSMTLLRPQRMLQCRQPSRVAIRGQAPFRGCFPVRASSAASPDDQELSNTSRSRLIRQKKAWLVAECEARGLETSGVKADLADRLLLETVPAETLTTDLPPNTKASDLHKLKKLELMAELRKRKLSTVGKKTDLVNRLMAALQAPKQVEEDLAAAALQLGRKLEALDRSVEDLSTRVEQRESSRAGIRQAAVAMLGDLTNMQAAWDADQAELAELEESVAVAQDEKSLLPALAARKEAVLARLQKLKAGIKGKEVLAVQLREKLQMVQRAKEVGVEELLVEEEVEEVMAVMASLTAAAAGGSNDNRADSRPPASIPAVQKPSRRPTSRASAAPNGAVNGSYAGPGRVQEVSAKTAVHVPEVSGTPPPSPPPPPPPSSSTPAPPKPASSDSPPAASPTPSRRWAKLRRPEAVGIAFSAVVMTVFSGIRSAFK